MAGRSLTPCGVMVIDDVTPDEADAFLAAILGDRHPSRAETAFPGPAPPPTGAATTQPGFPIYGVIVTTGSVGAPASLRSAVTSGALRCWATTT